jgi:hypothetical protein
MYLDLFITLHITNLKAEVWISVGIAPEILISILNRDEQ